MTITRFNYERRYRRRGVLIDCRWFLLRFYPPILPSWTFWPKVGGVPVWTWPTHWPKRATAPEEA